MVMGARERKMVVRMRTVSHLDTWSPAGRAA